MAATVKLHPLLVADMLAPPNFWDANASKLALVRALTIPRSKWVWLPIPAFLVEHPTEGPILIDTAFDASVARDPVESLGRRSAAMNKIRMEAGQAIPAQLQARGIDPADVRLVVMTHLHNDHASGIRQFPDAEFAVERREHEAASSGGFLQGYNPEHLEGAKRWRMLDVASAPPAAGFDHVLDVLGDGSIRLVFTPGHTHGHCSVLVSTGAGDVLLAADAAYARKTIGERLVPMYVLGDKDQYLDSLDTIAGWVAAHPDAHVICGHDPWNRADLERDY
jgi:glyoxylase-like metal-dependent hydrolase (beta-lactamase superfamily II)